MPVNKKATPGSSRTPRNAWPSAGSRSAAASRGPARKHSGSACSHNSTLRVAHASGTVCNRVAGVVSTNHKQPTYGRSEGSGRRSVTRAPLTIALATSTDRLYLGPDNEGWGAKNPAHIGVAAGPHVLRCRNSVPPQRLNDSLLV